MIIEVRVKNCYSFESQVIFSMKADMRNKKLSSNVHRENNFNVLKTAGIYGPNNVGKTCFVKCISAIKNILLNQNVGEIRNIFSDNMKSELGITFLNAGRKFSYDFIYNNKNEKYEYEKFVEIFKDQYGNEREEAWLIKDTLNHVYDCKDTELNSIMSIMAQDSLLFYLIDTSKFSCLGEIKSIITSFAKKIDIINMNNIPLQKTIDLMKNENDLQEKVVRFVKDADLYMDTFKYIDMDKINVEVETTRPDEKVLDIPEQIMDQMRLVSVYKGVPVPSVLFDSTGTKKIAALASYIVEGLEKGRILVIDELDSSIHFKLTRAIVTMFNNELNSNAQMIFTVHDVNLMDCKRLLRKEQIWFVHKDEQDTYMYSLAEFTAQQGVRDTTDIVEKYRKGIFGALPNPDMMETLLGINENKGEDAYE